MSDAGLENPQLKTPEKAAVVSEEARALREILDQKRGAFVYETRETEAVPDTTDEEKAEGERRGEAIVIKELLLRSIEEATERYTSVITVETDRIESRRRTDERIAREDEAKKNGDSGKQVSRWSRVLSQVKHYGKKAFTPPSIPDVDALGEYEHEEESYWVDEHKKRHPFKVGYHVDEPPDGPWKAVPDMYTQPLGDTGANLQIAFKDGEMTKVRIAWEGESTEEVEAMHSRRKGFYASDESYYPFATEDKFIEELVKSDNKQLSTLPMFRELVGKKNKQDYTAISAEFVLGEDAFGKDEKGNHNYGLVVEGTALEGGRYTIENSSIYPYDLMGKAFRREGESLFVQSLSPAEYVKFLEASLRLIPLKTQS